MQVNLDQNEVNALLAVLDSYLPGLRAEIGDTDNHDMRENLKAQEATLAGLVVKLGGSIEDTDNHNLGTKNPPWG
ncbi:MAG: hypothetical protein IVW55_03675 [Chloroflexi bacterium]|nr:hypothetical protein [Chloroflexota bacterium]